VKRMLSTLDVSTGDYGTERKNKMASVSILFIAINYVR